MVLNLLKSREPLPIMSQEIAARTYGLEAILATAMITCGMALMAPGETFILPHYALLKLYLTEEGTGAWMVFFGLFRTIGILMAGRYRSCPLFRLPGALFGAGFWLATASAVFLELLDDPTLPRNFGVPLLQPLSATLFVYEIMAGIRSGADAARHESFAWVREVFSGGRKDNGGRVV